MLTFSQIEIGMYFTREGSTSVYQKLSSPSGNKEYALHCSYVYEIKPEEFVTLCNSAGSPLKIRDLSRK